MTNRQCNRGVLLPVLVLLLAVTAAAGQQFYDEVDSGWSLLRNPNFHILAVEILTVDSDQATNREPPSGTVRLFEVIRGRDIEPGEYRFSLMAPVTADDLEDGQMKPEWSDRPMESPPLGERYIGFAYVNRYQLREDHTIVFQGGLVRYSDANRARIIETMAPMDRVWWIQLPVAVLILLLPFASLAGYLWSRRRSISESASSRARIVAWSAPVAAVVLYIYYETGISSYSDIRIDLILIWPALGFSLVLLLVYAVIALVRRGRANSR